MADVLAVCVQNNPYCQKAALELNVISLFLELIDSDSSEQVKVKALYALSCKYNHVLLILTCLNILFLGALCSADEL